jgi:hypothetical protein
MDAMDKMIEAIRASLAEDEFRLKFQVGELTMKYRERDAQRTAQLDELRDEDGEPLNGDYAKLDERRTDLALEADDDLSGLLRSLEELLA